MPFRIFATNDRYPTHAKARAAAEAAGHSGYICESTRGGQPTSTWVPLKDDVEPKADPLDDFNYVGSRHHY